MQVSILVLMDVTLQRSNRCLCRLCNRVSILVLMDVTLQLYNPKALYRTAIVSILVLMDVTLQPNSVFISLPLYKSFNPCFNGCYSSTTVIVSPAANPTSFQSLF